MGLFDWLTDGIGSSQGPAFEGSLMPGMGPSDAPPMPPNAVPPSPDPAVDTPPPLPGPAAGIPVPAPRPEGAPPLPMLAARTAGAPSQLPPLPPPTGQSALPPNATPTSGLGMPPGPPTPLSPAQAGNAYSSYQAAGGGGPVSIYGTDGITPPGGSSAIGRALGLDANKERSLWGGLGAAMTAAGNSAGKTKGQAFFSGVGAGLQGSEKTDDKAYDQRLKALTLAVSAQAKGDTAEANRAYTAYLKDRDTAKMTPDSRGGAWNKPDSQKYIDVKRMVQQDKQVGALADAVKQATKDNNPTLAAEKNAELQAITQKKENEAFGVMGMSPRTIATLQGNPPGTAQNPHQVATQKELNLYVKPGEHYVVPAGPHKGEIYIREDKDAKGTEGGKPAPQAASPAPQAASPTPNVPPMPPPPFKSGRSIGSDPEDTLRSEEADNGV